MSCCHLLTQLASLGFACNLKQQQGFWTSAAQKLREMPEAMLPLITEIFDPINDTGLAKSCNTDLLKAMLVSHNTYHLSPILKSPLEAWLNVLVHLQSHHCQDFDEQSISMPEEVTNGKGTML